MDIEALRTPESAFQNLPDWPYQPKYISDLQGFGTLRLHYIDEGPENAKDIFLCLHGQPTWSYLYRKMIPVFLAAGARVIAPDWFGFGRSDKPTHDASYTYNFHRNTILSFLKHLNLKNITLVLQDWGGLLGLTLPMAAPDRFKRLLIMNTALAVGRSPGQGFEDWRSFSDAHPDMDIARLMARAVPILSREEAEAYAAPFPDIFYKAGVRRFPQLVMTDPKMEGVDISQKSQAFLRDRWNGESFMAIGMQDPVLGKDIMKELHTQIRGCPEPLYLNEAGHFVPEWGEDIAKAALSHWGIKSRNQKGGGNV